MDRWMGAEGKGRGKKVIFAGKLLPSEILCILTSFVLTMRTGVSVPKDSFFFFFSNLDEFLRRKKNDINFATNN